MGLARALTPLAACLALAPGGAAAEIVFLGLPQSRVIAHEGATQREDLAPGARTDAATLISRTPQGFAWTSRGDIPLSRTTSGIYEIYTAPGGAGFIKIQTFPLPGEDPGARPCLEVIHQHLVTITHFGTGSPQP